VRVEEGDQEGFCDRQSCESGQLSSVWLILTCFIALAVEAQTEGEMIVSRMALDMLTQHTP
jgi:hypothetical protein